MAADDLEKRVAALEAEVAKLKATSDSTAERPHQWWNEIAGSFADDPVYEEAMRLGREWRESFRARSRPRNKRTHDHP